MKKKIVLLLIGLAGLVNAQVPTAGLIGRWEFNNNYNDGSPTNNHALVTWPNYAPNLPVFVTDRCNNANSAVRFNGTNQFLEMPLQNGPLGQNPRSVSFWMRTTNTNFGGTGTSKAIFSYGQITVGSSPLGGAWEVDHNYIASGAGIDVSNQAFTAPTNCLTDGDWHHVVAIVPNSTNAVVGYTETILYFDGVLQNPNNYTQSQGMTQALQTLNSSILVGCNLEVPHQRYYLGDLDDIYFYNRELTYAEVLQLLNTNCGITAAPCWCDLNNVFTTPTVAGATNYAWSVSSNVSILSTPPFGNSINVTSSGGVAFATVTITTANCGFIIRSFSLPYIQCGNSQVNLVTSPTTATICANQINSMVLTANIVGNVGPVTYNWTPGNQTGPSIIVSPTSTQVYQVTATSLDFCPLTANILVTVQNNCCPNSPSSTTQTLTSLAGNYGPGTYIILNNITLNNNTTFSGAEVLLAENVKITVPPTMNLHLDGAHLYACGIKMWQGIEIMNTGYVSSTPLNSSTAPTNLIEDAIIAIDLSQIQSNFYNPPIDIQNTTFNKNHTAIKISNANSGVTNLPISLLGCVFTSRDMPFTASTWPSADQTDLRQTTAAALNGLASPFNVGNWPYANLKIPFNNQGAVYGIKIEEIDNTPGAATNVGVDIGFTYQGAAANNSSADFNLFDNLGVGIDITNASLTSMNNVFQNMIYNSAITGMFGCGIRDVATNDPVPPPGIFNMNARLDLRPVGVGNQSTAFGNRFWNCRIGIQTKNVYEILVEYGVFRTNQSTTPPPIQSNYGMALETNRFDYGIKYCEFNNLGYGIDISTKPDFFDVNSTGLLNGIYANNLKIEQNYFGAHVNSSTNLNNGEFFGDAIRLSGPNAALYTQALGASATIVSNKIDRAYRGISLSSMFDYPVNILGNNIFIVDNVLPPFTAQYGIEAQFNSGNLVIRDNDLRSTNTSNVNTCLVYCNNNIGTNTMLGIGSPIVECNKTTTSYKGFEFEGNNANCSWKGNSMRNQTYGFVLSNSGVIGQQGNLAFPSNNEWIGSGWNSPGWQTWCNNSNANASPLFVANTTNFNPTANGGGTTPYATGSSNLKIAKRGVGFKCPIPNYPTLPSQRMQNSSLLAIDDEASETESVEFYPNPTKDLLTIKTSFETSQLSIRILDVNGKVVFSRESNAQFEHIIDVSDLKAAMYFIEIKCNNGQVFHEKLIRE